MTIHAEAPWIAAGQPVSQAMTCSAQGARGIGDSAHAHGGDGNDTLLGGAGNDALNGGPAPAS